MLSYKQREIAYILNIVSLAGITAISLAAIAIQFLLVRRHDYCST
ncbi:hypothetical protein QIW49_07175 [Francisellaceae bacterium CB300]